MFSRLIVSLASMFQRSPGAIDNTNLVNYRGCLPAGFTPALTYAYNAGAKTVTVTDATVIPAGDTLKKIRVRIHDKFGNEVRGSISALLGNTGAVSTATLDDSKGLDITVTITTTNMIAADGGAYHIGAAGSIANWDIQQNA
jgi:hypothetical protein